LSGDPIQFIGIWIMKTFREPMQTSAHRGPRRPT
jgi:hypothetical protein